MTPLRCLLTLSLPILTATPALAANITMANNCNEPIRVVITTKEASGPVGLGLNYKSTAWNNLPAGYSASYNGYGGDHVYVFAKRHSDDRILTDGGNAFCDAQPLYFNGKPMVSYQVYEAQYSNPDGSRSIYYSRDVDYGDRVLAVLTNLRAPSTGTCGHSELKLQGGYQYVAVNGDVELSVTCD